jgi:hypothetical protein
MDGSELELACTSPGKIHAPAAAPAHRPINRLLLVAFMRESVTENAIPADATGTKVSREFVPHSKQRLSRVSRSARMAKSCTDWLMMARKLEFASGGFFSVA